MDNMKQLRKVRRGLFTKYYDRVELKLNEEIQNQDDLRLDLETLEDKYKELKKLDSEILELTMKDEIEESSLEVELELSEKYDLKYRSIRLSINSILNRSKKEESSSNLGSNGTHPKRNIRLPKLELRKFGGDPREWIQFWAQFSQIDKDETLEASDKLQYLLQATVAGSRARIVAESYPPSGENYPKIISALKARFGRKDLLTEIYTRELIAVVLQKSKFNTLSSLYDKLESFMRALETLEINIDDSAPFLFPLVESCLPEELLRTWQRQTTFAQSLGISRGNEEIVITSYKTQLENLMLFMRTEVENEEKLSIAMAGVDEENYYSGKQPGIQSAAGLLTINKKVLCIFCKGKHTSEDCKKALNMDYEEKIKLLSASKCCYRCLKPGHFAKDCRVYSKCARCQKRHKVVICQSFNKENRALEAEKEIKTPACKEVVDNSLIASVSSPHVLIQTVIVYLLGSNITRRMRVILDSGSQNSYILKSTAEEFKLKPIKRETITHSLFGGLKTESVEHNRYRIHIESVSHSYRCNFEVLDQNRICGDISPIPITSFIDELKEEGIFFSDIVEGPIEILIGADILGKLLTGKKRVLSNGLVALHTELGWTVMGKLEHFVNKTNCTLLTTSNSIPNLWELETLGIKDPEDRMNQAEIDEAVKQHFLETVSIDEEGRYEVCLPWKRGHVEVPNNFESAVKRLFNTLNRLKATGFVDNYQKVFQEWEEEKIIERVPQEELNVMSHYLPHRPVLKMNSTTKVRPVFDASAKEGEGASLNDCLWKGINLIELIPTALFKFRLFKIGVSADIKKAFLQIGVANKERDFLRFLWIDRDEQLVIFRHRRVVFGVCCSPFLLGAVINHHLEKMLEHCRNDGKGEMENTVRMLMESFYCDNCVTSVHNTDQLQTFAREARWIMEKGKFDLRGWESTMMQPTAEISVNTQVLGINWNRCDDTLSLSFEPIKNMDFSSLTKRKILSVVHRIYDPMGFTCPVLIKPKILLQVIWTRKVPWDQEIDTDLAKQFRRWLVKLPVLFDVQIPRWFSVEDQVSWNLHVFVDACKTSYAAAIFLRTEEGKVHLVIARSRVAPLKELTIPRLELMAAVIGVRLCYSFLKDLKSFNVNCYYWTDSSTVLAWINRQENWSTFVQNRVREIRNLSNAGHWNYVPSSQNPADLPSRGCDAEALYECKWWEGPTWLRKPPECWPTASVVYDEDKVDEERKKTAVSMINQVQQRSLEFERYFHYFSKFSKIVRMIGWICRFIHNSQVHSGEKTEKEIVQSQKKRHHGELLPEEYEQAEIVTLRLVQLSSFKDFQDERLVSLCTFQGNDKLIRVKTKSSNREDLMNFRYPVILPGDHPVVRRLIFEEHVRACHAGVQNLLSLLRERFWILRGRSSVRAAIGSCRTCKRYDSRAMNVRVTPLPLDRVRDAGVFEVCGVDFAGPLFIRSGEKVWISLFTCGVYRAVHLEIVPSLSSTAFLQALRRFVARRGRPSLIFSDNGTNFAGTENALSRLDWDEIMKYSCVNRIGWRFIPPAAPWWGGWWERLVGLMKRLLRKVLGKASLTQEELQTVICECEAVLNSRPVSYLSEDSNDLKPLTPSMFLQDVHEVGVPDLDKLDGESFRRRIRYRQKILHDLRQRFRVEYLGQLSLKPRGKERRIIKEGDVVIIGDDLHKRMDWVLGRVVKLISGRDGEARVAKLRTSKGIIIRPLQRLFPLEAENADVALKVEEAETEIEQEADKVQESDEEEREEEQKFTRYGRRVQRPQRFL